MTENEIVGWHHRSNGHEFEEASGVGDGQGGLTCCSPWGCKESDKTDWTELNWTEVAIEMHNNPFSHLSQCEDRLYGPMSTGYILANWEQLNSYTFCFYPDLFWFLGFCQGLLVNPRLPGYPFSFLFFFFFCHLNAPFNIIIEISFKDDSIWSIGCQETPAEWLLKPKIFPLAVASLCFVEGVHTHYNQNVGIVLAIPIHWLCHWGTLNQLWYFLSVQINSLVLLSRKPNKNFGLLAAFHELGWHSQNELDNSKPELGFEH